MVASRVIGTICLCVCFVAFPRSASADWLFSAFVGPIRGVQTNATGSGVPAESFEGSNGIGLNVATAFPSRANLGFEFDWGIYNNALKTSDVFGTDFAAKVMSFSPNFFYSMSTSRVRPYVAIGPSFNYRSDRDESTAEFPGGWGVGLNAGGGAMVFVNEHVAGRADVRIFRNFGDFVDLTDVDSGGQQWNGLRFVRVFFGVTLR